MILWDSRTIHCNTPSLVYPNNIPDNKLLRAVSYICMTPRSWADNNIISKRIEAFEKNITTSHWPHYANYDQQLVNITEKINNYELISIEKRNLIGIIKE